MKHFNRIAICLALYTIVNWYAAESTAWASLPPYRATISQRSSSVGLGISDLPVLQRKAGIGRNVAITEAQSVARSLWGESGKAVYSPSSVESDFAAVTVGDWFVEVRGDGDWVRAGLDGEALATHLKPVSESDRIPDSALEVAAQQFVTAYLEKFVPIQIGESLHLWDVVHLLSVDTDNRGEVHRELVASRVTLIRAINGVPVLGPGSKVMVEVASGGESIGFWVDWSRYGSTGERTSVLTLAASKERLAGLPYAPNGGEELQFECGYYDAGAAYLSPTARLQPACISLQQLPPEGDFSRGRVYSVVPIGTTVWADDAWPATQLFAPQ